MTPEQFQEMVWGKPIKPNLPKFERTILVKHGSNISANTVQREKQIAREQKRANYGRQPEMIDNPVYGLEFDWRVRERIKGMVKSFKVADSHKGDIVLPSIVIKVLDTYSEFNRKTIEWDYNFSERHARVYIRVIQACIASIENLDLPPKDDEICNSTIKNFLINQ